MLVAVEHSLSFLQFPVKPTQSHPICSSSLDIHKLLVVQMDVLMLSAMNLSICTRRV